MRLPLALVTLLVVCLSDFFLCSAAPPSRVAVRSPFSLGESFRGPSLTMLEGEMLRLEAREANPAHFTFIDIVSGERFLGDPKDPMAAMVLDYDPSLGMAILAVGDGTWVAKNLASGESSTPFDPELSLREIKLNRSGERAIAVGYDYRQVGLTVRAFDLASGEEAWESLFPNTSSFALSADRSTVCMFKEDTGQGTKHLERYDAYAGILLDEVSLTELGIQGSVSRIPAYSVNGRYAYVRQNSPPKAWLVDIEEGTLTDRGMASPIWTSEDSLYALEIAEGQFRIVSYELAETIFTQSADATPPPLFLGASQKALYYDKADGTLRKLNLQTGESELFRELPEGVSELALFQVSRNLRYVAFIDGDHRIHFVDTINESLVTREVSIDRPLFVEIAEDSGKLVLGDLYGNVVSLAVDDLQAEETLAEEAAAIVESTASGDIAALFASGRIELYDADSFSQKGAWEVSSMPGQNFLSLASSVSLLVAQSRDALEVINYETGEAVFSYDFDPQTEGISEATLSSDGAFLALESGSGSYPDIEFKFEVVRVSSGESVFSIMEGAERIAYPIFSDVGDRLSFLQLLESNQVEVSTYSLEDGSLVSKTDPLVGGGELSMNGDGTAGYFLQGTTLKKVDLTTGLVSDFFNLASIVFSSLQRFALSSDESLLAVVAYNHDVVLYDLEKSELIAQMPAEWVYNNEYISYDLDGALEFQADGSGLVFGNGDGSFRFWKLLALQGSVPGSLQWTEAGLLARFPVEKGRAYRIEESGDLGWWSGEDPFEGGLAPAAGEEVRELTPDDAAFIRLWEYE